MRQKDPISGPNKGPLFLFTTVMLVSLGGSATAAAILSARVISPHSGLDNFLVDLYSNHRLLYAIVVTVSTAVLGIALSLVMGWLLRILRIDRVR